MILDIEINNKVIHGLNAQDIKFSILKKLIASEKIQIYSETVGAYDSMTLSLNDTGIFTSDKNKTNTYVPTNKVINSNFYQYKATAKLYYEECFNKIIDLNLRLANDDYFNDEVERILISITSSQKNVRR